MDFIALEIIIDSGNSSVISQKKQHFYSKVSSLLFPEEKTCNRLGAVRATFINHYQNIYNPDTIRKAVIDRIEKAVDESGSIDLFIIDFTGNLFTNVRDPMLLSLANGVEIVCAKSHCRNFAILLPELPGSKGASMIRFSGLLKSLNDEINYGICFLSSNGQEIRFGNTWTSLVSITKEYADLVSSLMPSTIDRLSNRCVRRLGHFRNYDPKLKIGRCRYFSYYLHDCCTELEELFSDWWGNYCKNGKAILFDLRNNTPFREAILAFAERRGISCERIVDVPNDKMLADQMSSYGKVVIVLDVVDTGETLLNYSEMLSSIGIEFDNNVCVAINKGGDKSTTIGDFKVSGFIAKTSDFVEGTCPQCAIKLPFTDDAEESHVKIRSFDMLLMATKSGWVPEPTNEVPDNIGLGYKILPNFDKMMYEFGDFISYKLHIALSSGNHPEQWFIIHPDEAASSAISSRLQEYLDCKVPTIKIPREIIKEAQNNNNHWDRMVSDYQDAPWMEDIKEMSNASAIILDVFNASGSTCATISSLLVKYLRLNVFGYFCIIDYSPETENTIIGGVKKNSLYDWNNPRILIAENMSNEE